MKKSCLTAITSQVEWDSIIAEFSGSNIYQSWSYGKEHSLSKYRQVKRFVLFENDASVIASQFRIKMIPIIKFGIAEANWAPLIKIKNNESWEKNLETFLTSIVKEFNLKKMIIRFETISSYDVSNDEKIKEIFERNGYRQNKQKRTYRTTVLDLDKSMEKLLADLNKKWRQGLSYAQKAELSVETGSDNNFYSRFLKIYNEMMKVKKFPTGVDINAIGRIVDSLDKNQKIDIWIARKNDQDIGATICSTAGDSTLYFLAATLPGSRGPLQPGYLLLWESIRKAKERGIKWFDLGGLTDIPDSGVDKFKNRMNGTRIMFPGWYEYSAEKYVKCVINYSEKLTRLIKR